MLFYLSIYKNDAKISLLLKGFNLYANKLKKNLIFDNLFTY